MDAIKKIVSDIRTREERDALFSALRLVRGGIFRRGAEHLSRELVSAGIPAEISRPLVEALRENETRDHREQSDFLETLKKSLDDLAVLKLEISFEPRERTIEKLSAWAKREVGEDAIFDITVSHSICGGTRVSFEGRYREYTLDSLISSVFESNQDQIKKMIS